MQNGTSTEEIANAPPKIRRKRSVVTDLRNAKLAPRRTMPRAAMVSGTNMVSQIEAYAVGEGRPGHDEDEDQPDVVGLPDGTDRALDDGPRRRAPLLRAAGRQVPEAGAEVRAAQDGVRREGEQQHDRDDGAHGAGSTVSGGSLRVGP